MPYKTIPNKTKFTLITSSLLMGAFAASNAHAEPMRVTVKIENVAPMQATFQTPVWLGLHDGNAFDIYNTGSPANTLPIAGSRAFESICEDGSTALISENFSALQTAGRQTTLAGPNGPIAPGDVAEFSFEVESTDQNTRYLSYASMVLPSNDFCIANGNPKAHPMFDENGNFIAQSFFVTGTEVLDAGTEVNDESTENTAFFGQAAPDTGIDENGNVRPTMTSFDPDLTGGVLSDERFAEGNFLQNGYSTLKFTFSAEPVVEVEPEPQPELPLRFSARLSSQNVVPAVESRAFGLIRARSFDEGESIRLGIAVARLSANDEITGAEIRLAAEGENGPLAVDITANAEFKVLAKGRLRRLLTTINEGDLTGELAGASLQDLQQAINEGNAYVAIITTNNPNGVLRGQLQ